MGIIYIKWNDRGRKISSFCPNHKRFYHENDSFYYNHKRYYYNHKRCCRKNGSFYNNHNRLFEKKSIKS